MTSQVFPCGEQSRPKQQSRQEQQCHQEQQAREEQQIRQQQIRKKFRLPQIDRSTANMATQVRDANITTTRSPSSPTFSKRSTCPICQEPIKFREAAKVMNCNHQFCIKCIDQWLAETRDAILGDNEVRNATCPCCRGHISNIAYNFGKRGAFSTLLNDAKGWYRNTITVDDRFIKHSETFYQVCFSSRIRVMQSGGMTTTALSKRLVLKRFRKIRDDFDFEYRDTMTEPTAARDIKKIKDDLEKYAQLYGDCLVPDRPGYQNCNAFGSYEMSPDSSKQNGDLKSYSFGSVGGWIRRKEGRVLGGFISDHRVLYETRREDLKALVRCINGKPQMTTDFSHLTEEIRRTLDGTLLVDFDGTISTAIMSNRMVQGSELGSLAQRKRKPHIISRVRALQGRGSFLFDAGKKSLHQPS
ncbi:hypothetical protein HYALB_00013662 [Hymenoscyphus albidus]|uniref:RING-type domain-containing protein n=1 Tax=Hymenoscyphus albidus TaxID=595503 RepID=A0A9N9LZP7_9HELO|nr:hypothetical protein HYALB_00013662 [Hymenoscyphus albidus]